ncbi:EmrB/QacA subfamily drug resistance transporter [Lysinibacillus composti]|uniref:DHA2 family efflux MFS transporter permease subunit n=1 Tax=Lysinibacillus composti TaxID=720633 RepID=A0A3N9UJY2_9BACI|nr:DHA2 family efflux MFS transporter permease subunit [Lysinibacillus composti]MBM7607148.1 EmrB/QacA subfamily drug resistance transporter [Lysinibacillus composti]RQW76264.1 DHA2 family efflux MFS transporter permease subunit [Lysinibacillus composti]
MSTTTAVPAPSHDSSSKERWLALVAIIVGAFVAVLNNSLINVAIPSLTTELGSTQSTIQWVLTGYMLASGVIVPIVGFMEERIGYKKFLLVALGVFTIGTVLCAVAWNDTSLIAARIITGLGGGVIGPLSMTVIYKIMPRDQISVALSLWGVSAMVAPAIGPTLSGYLIEWFNWRFLFIICVPIGAIAFIAVWVLLKEPKKQQAKPFDALGFFLAATFAGTLLYALSSGQKEGWGSFEIVFLFFISFWSLVFLIFVEANTENPVIDLSLFKNFTFMVSNIISSLVMVGLMGAMFILPLFLQNIQKLGPINTGLLMMPQAICMAVTMPIAGKLFNKTGPIPLGIIGLTLMATTTYKLAFITPETMHSWMIPVLMLRGIGTGLCMMPISTAGMNAVAPHLVGKASGLSNLMRSISSSMCIAVFTLIMQQRTALHLQEISGSIPIEKAQEAQLLYGSSWNSSLSSIMQVQAASRGMTDVFYIASMTLFICIPLVLIFKRRKKPEKQITDTLNEKGDSNES